MDYRKEGMNEVNVPNEAAEQITVAAALEMATPEQQEMNEFAEMPVSETEAAEQREMDECTKLGYSSGYYEHQMARALESGNKIAYENARKHWADAKVKEST